MHTKLVVLGLLFAVSAASTAQAQVTVDVSKINCDEFVHHKVSTPNVIAAWFSGYYNVIHAVVDNYHPQAPKGTPMAGASSALDVPLYPDLRVLA
jgi:HdeA/HdeB family